MRIAAPFFILLPALAAAQSGVWRIETVDAGGGGRFSSLRADTLGNYHVAYTDSAANLLKYAFWDSGPKKWFSMVLDRSAGFCSLALDSHQRPHISYVEYGTDRLKYAHWNGTAWLKEVIPLPARDIEFYTSIALNAQDEPAITYYEYIGAEGGDFLLHLRTVQRSADAWQASTIDFTRGSGKFNAVVSDSKGMMQVAYANVSEGTHSIRYARQTANGWQTEILEGAGTANPEHVGWSAAITLDRQDRPHIVYLNQDRNLVRYATRLATGWHLETVDALVNNAYPDRFSIALDEEGQPWISYYDLGRGELRVAYRENNRWIVEVVDGNYCGYTSSLQIANGEVVVTYYDSGDNSLKCARRQLNLSRTALKK